MLRDQPLQRLPQLSMQRKIAIGIQDNLPEIVGLGFSGGGHSEKSDNDELLQVNPSLKEIKCCVTESGASNEIGNPCNYREFDGLIRIRKEICLIRVLVFVAVKNQGTLHLHTFVFRNIHLPQALLYSG